jgi:hypothetical protein
MNFIAVTKLGEALQAKCVGQPVNVHVVPAREEPQPDFDAMQRLIEGSDKPTTESKSGTKG